VNELPEADSRVVRLPVKGSAADFAQKMADAVARGLEPLGASGKLATLYFIEKKHGLMLTESFTDPDRFISALTAMYGRGTQILEISIVKEIVLAFGLSTTPTSFQSAVKEAARQYKPTQK
jgi:hypothetical protein